MDIAVKDNFGYFYLKTENIIFKSIIDYKKAFCKINGNKLIEILVEGNIPNHLVWQIQFDGSNNSQKSMNRKKLIEL
jgi:hypothetical protein